MYKTNFFLLFSLIILFPNFVIQINSEKPKNESEIQIKEYKSLKITKNNDFTNHSPIMIDSDEDFSLYSSIGNGTEMNPYIIENLSIKNDSSDLLKIEGTTMFFIIRNNYLDGVSKNFDGIHLTKIDNAQIINNTIKNTVNGIYFETAINCLIENNTFRDNSKNGLGLSSAENCTIAGNQAFNNYRNGISLVGNNNRIWNNAVYDNYFSGISLGDYSNDNEIFYNLIFNNRLDGIILLKFSNSNYIYNNELYNNSIGINVNQCYYNSINSNLIFDCEFGILVTILGYGTIISNNNIQNNSQYGVSLGLESSSSFVSSCVVKLNYFYNNCYSNDNLSQAYEYIDVAINNTQNTFIFNFWAEWKSPDINQDGFVDNPYLINGSNNVDNYPLESYRDKIENHFLSETRILKPYVENNDSVYIYWKPVIDSFNFSVQYSLYYSNDQGNTWKELVTNFIYQNFFWNINSIISGCYQLKVIASSEGGLSTEANTENFPLKMNHTLSYPEFISPDINKILSENVTIQWTPSIDNCYYSVTYNLSYSVDGGNTWILLCSGNNTTSFEWDTTTVSYGDNYKLKIVAISSSGLISTMITEKAFIINNDAFQLFIKKIPFLDIFLVLFIFVELISLNFLIKFIQKKKNSSI